MTDAEVLRELMASVYVTPRQKEVLRRTIARMPEVPKAHVQRAMRRLTARLVNVETEESAVEEDERHALLGPCGAG